MPVVLVLMQNNQTIKFIMITKDAITMYICCCALFLKEMQIFN